MDNGIMVAWTGFQRLLLGLGERPPTRTEDVELFVEAPPPRAPPLCPHPPTSSTPTHPLCRLLPPPCSLLLLLLLQRYTPCRAARQAARLPRPAQPTDAPVPSASPSTQVRPRWPIGERDVRSTTQQQQLSKRKNGLQAKASSDQPKRAKGAK